MVLSAALVLQELSDGAMVLVFVVQVQEDLHLILREVGLLETNESIISSSLEEQELTQSEHLWNGVCV